MDNCGLCAMLSGLLRRATCVGSRRDSNESYYRDLENQDILMIMDDDAEPSVEAIMFQVPGEHQEMPDEHQQINYLTSWNINPGRRRSLNKRRKLVGLSRSLRMSRALVDDLYFSQVRGLLRRTINWRFDPFCLDNATNGRCLPFLCYYLFETYGLISHFRLDPVKLWKLFILIEEGYHATNPYHNTVHAADVTQAMHCFLQQKKIRKRITPAEVMATLLATIAHDVDHPGLNQAFFIKTSNFLATLYNGTSVLENHHYRTAISCINESGVIDHLPNRVWIKKRIASMILATDITRQQDYLTQFKAYLDNQKLNMRKKHQRHLVLQIALKCADISNPCRHWQISKKWSLKVCEEFFRQGDYEKRLDLPVTILCDRETATIPTIQTGFLRYVVTPLISEWHRFLHNRLSQKMVKNLIRNQRKWETLAIEEEEQDSITEITDADMVENDLITHSATSSLESLPEEPHCSYSFNETNQSELMEPIEQDSVPLDEFLNLDEFDEADLLSELFKLEDLMSTDSDYSFESLSSDESLHEDDEAIVENVHSTEIPLPTSSNAIKPKPIQALTVMEQYSQLIRLQAIQKTSGTYSLACRSVYTSNDDCSTFDNNKKEYKPDSISKRDDSEHCDTPERATGNETLNSETDNWNLSDVPARRRESFGMDSVDNATSLQLGPLERVQLQMRRQSMPAEIVAYTPKETKPRVVQGPQVQYQGIESLKGRRGSAPAPISASELRGLATLRASVSGGCRNPNPIVTCQQWLTKTTNNAHANSFPQHPRRSSLPAELSHPTDDSEMKTARSKLDTLPPKEDIAISARRSSSNL